MAKIASYNERRRRFCLICLEFAVGVCTQFLMRKTDKSFLKFLSGRRYVLKRNSLIVIMLCFKTPISHRSRLAIIHRSQLWSSRRQPPTTISHRKTPPIHINRKSSPLRRRSGHHQSSGQHWHWNRCRCR